MNKKEMRLFLLKNRMGELVETYNNAKADLILNAKKAIIIILDIQEQVDNGDAQIVVMDSGQMDRIEISVIFVNSFVYCVRLFRENLKVDDHFYNPFRLKNDQLEELKKYFEEDEEWGEVAKACLAYMSEDEIDIDDLLNEEEEKEVERE